MVVAVSEAIAQYLVEKRGLPAAKVRNIENGVDLAMFHPAPPDPSWRSRLLDGGSIVCSYIGTLGNASHLWTLLDAAKILRRRLPEVRFALVGAGAEREALEAQALAWGLDNVKFHGEQPRHEIPKVINASDLCLVLLRRDDVFKTVIPSKLLEFMACGRPVLLGVDGQARKLLEEARAGAFVPPQDPEALAQAVAHMVACRDRWPAFGGNGAAYIRARFSRQAKAREYLKVLEEVVHCTTASTTRH